MLVNVHAIDEKHACTKHDAEILVLYSFPWLLCETFFEDSSLILKMRNIWLFTSMNTSINGCIK